MRTNLILEMTKRGVKIDAISSLIGVHRNSVHNKIYGIHDFTLTEALSILDTFFPDCDIRELFANDEK